VLETLLDDLRHRELLIVLDNCEHLIDACAAFAERELAASAATRILATSHEALEISGKVDWRVRYWGCGACARLVHVQSDGEFSPKS
jgi:predicted ATPase